MKSVDWPADRAGNDADVDIRLTMADTSDPPRSFRVLAMRCDHDVDL